MRIALLCKRYYTNRDLVSDRFGRLYHLPLELSKLGHSALVVAADYRSLRRETITDGEMQIHSVPMLAGGGLGFMTSAYSAIKSFQPDILVASSDIHFGVLGGLFAKRLNIPFAFDIYDDYSVFRLAKIPGMRTAFSAALKRADLLISASAPLAHKLAGLNRSVTVIENGVDQSIFRPLPKASARDELGIPQRETVIGFFGSIAKNRGIEQLIEARQIISQIRPATRLLLAGAIRVPLQLEVPGVDYRGVLPQHQLPSLINACDVVVVPYLPDPQVDMSNACKIAEYVACSVPVVTTRVSNFAEIFAEAPQAVCEPGDPQALAQAILRQIEAPQRLPFNSRPFSWSALAQKLEGELLALVTIRSGARVAAV